MEGDECPKRAFFKPAALFRGKERALRCQALTMLQKWIWGLIWVNDSQPASPQGSHTTDREELLQTGLWTNSSHLEVYGKLLLKQRNLKAEEVSQHLQALEMAGGCNKVPLEYLTPRQWAVFNGSGSRGVTKSIMLEWRSLQVLQLRGLSLVWVHFLWVIVAGFFSPPFHQSFQFPCEFFRLNPQPDEDLEGGCQRVEVY